MPGSARATSYADAVGGFSWADLWALFDGDDEHLNIAHECLDRHDPEAVGARIAYADGSTVELSFGDVAAAASRFAHAIADLGVGVGDRVGIMMEPSLAFYAAVFGTIKRGAVAVPLYTLFGQDAIRDRLDDCAASLLVVDEATAARAEGLAYRVLRFDGGFAADLAGLPDTWEVATAARDLAILQYTSGTTRQLPEAVPHDQRSIVTLARAGLFALGLADGDRYFCPSSPAWGHGMWHGTIAPWSLGVPLGTYSGRFAIERLIDALRDLRITNLAAASTVYRMLLSSGRLSELDSLAKASYTGEELDGVAQQQFRDAVGVPVCGMYGTTETGVILGNFPGFPDYKPRVGALGKPIPGCDVSVRAEDGSESPVGVTGEIHIRRRGEWFGAKDLGHLDEYGYFWYGGRADDVIISAGWTISPLEVERTLLGDDDVLEAAVIGAPDDVRGLIVKAVLVARRTDDEYVAELQELVRRQLSPHEYPRAIEFIDELPKTPNGKVNRKALREAEAARQT